MRNKDYYRAEFVRTILYPLVLVLLASFFVGQGWVNPEHVKILWDVIIIQVIAGLLTLGIYYYFLAKK